MNTEQLEAAKAKLAAMNVTDQELRVRLESLDADAAELAGRLQIVEDEVRALREEAEAKLRELSDQRGSALRERVLQLRKRKDLKMEYGILYEQVGRAERAARAAAAEKNAS